MSSTNKFSALLGGAVSGVVAWKLLQPEMTQHGPSRFLASSSGTSTGGDNATALITGASAGIGKAFAQRLAREGYDVVLVARRKERLDALADELKSQCSVNAQSVAADLADPADIERVASVTADLSEAGKLDLLVNNAGFGTVGSYADVPIKDHRSMVNVHVMAPAELTRAALPGMIRRGHAGIINVASVAGWFPLPGNVNYSASKRYLITFSEALQTELCGTGVFVQALCPGFTYSEFHDTEPFQTSGFRREQFPSFMWQTADQVADASLNALSREGVCIPGIHNRMMTMMHGLIPRALIRQARNLLGDPR